MLTTTNLSFAFINSKIRFTCNILKYDIYNFNVISHS